MVKRKRRKGIEESPEVLKKRAEELASQPEYDSRKNQPAMLALLFTLGKQIFAIDAKSVKEILNPFALKWVPFTPNFIAGVVNLRGDIVTVFDIGAFQEKANQISNEESEIIILKYEDILCGFLVDMAQEIIEVNEDELLPPLPTEQKLSNFFSSTIKREKHFYQVIDLKKLLQSEEVAALWRSSSQDKTATEITL